MISIVKRPPIWFGALLGALLTAPLMALLFIGERFAGLPFLPLDFFNWFARVLPGRVLTFGIDSMVDTLIALGLGGDLDSAAKTAERVMGLGLFLSIGIVAGLIFFFVLNRIDWRENNYLPGLALALVVGLPFTVFGLQGNVSATAPFTMQVIWLALLFIGYGTAFSWAYNELAFPLIQVNKEKNDVEIEGIDRRQFIVRVGGASATLTVVGAGLGALFNDTTTSQSSSDVTSDIIANDSGNVSLPNTDDSAFSAPGTRQEITPVRDHYRIDILSGGTPSIPAEYALPIVGLVENPVEWTLDEIREMPNMTEYLTMACISNRVGGSLISTTKWTGVSFQHILEQVRPTEAAQALKITGYDGFDEYIDLELIRNDERVMLTYAWDDEPLPDRNGFPLRTHIPDRYGMKQPKWINQIEVVDSWEPGYWVRRSWSRDAIVNATSVIDTVASRAAYSDEEGQLYVPIGGIAWAGDRNIIRVEIRVDNGEWMEAQLREPLSERAWTIWRYDWPFVEGAHTFEVQAYEANSEGQSDPILQPTATRGTRPDGATGIHAVNEIVSAPEASTDSG